MIPKIIHYCWFGGNPIPKEFKKYMKSWKKFCPDYEIKEWNESNFDFNSHPFVKEAYKNKKWAFVSDYVRLWVVYNYGGIYLDTDVELLKSLDDLLNNNFYIGIEQSDLRVNTGLGFGAEKKNEIVRELLSVYDDVNYDNNDLNNFSCPILNTNVLSRFGYQNKDENQFLKNGSIIIYSSEYFDPISPSTKNNNLSSSTYSIHHYSASWLSKKKVFKRRIANFLGQENINKLKKIINK